MMEIFYLRSHNNRRSLLVLLHILLLILLSVVAQSQCTAPAATTGQPQAPTLDDPISADATYISGEGIAGNTVVICIDGKPTVPPTTATVAQDRTFKAPLNIPLNLGQKVTAQQYNPTGTLVYSPLSNEVVVSFDTCLEALQSGVCQFRIEIDTSGAVGNGSQTNTSTTPNLMVILDYQWHPPQDVKAINAEKKRLSTGKELPDSPDATGGAKVNPDPPKGGKVPGEDKLPRLAAHIRGKFGYTQTFAASSVQPAPTSGNPTPACPNNSKSPSSANCMLAVPKSAFVAELGAKLGGTTGVDRAGFYGEYGLSGRGSFQYLIPTNQIVQNNGASFIDLSSTNPHNAVGFYEIAGYADVAQHDHILSQYKAENSSPLLVIEGGFQNNRALQQLLPTNPKTSTRNRYVGRFSFNYEVSKTTHSKISFGVEYSGGINGGPHIVQLFIGGTLNPAKLFGGNGS